MFLVLGLLLRVFPYHWFSTNWLIWMYLGVTFFLFILLGVLWASYIFAFMSCQTSSNTFSVQYSFILFFTLLTIWLTPLYCPTTYLGEIYWFFFEQDNFIFLLTFFSLCFSFDSFYCSFFKITDVFPSVQYAVKPIQ